MFHASRTPKTGITQGGTRIPAILALVNSTSVKQSLYWAHQARLLSFPANLGFLVLVSLMSFHNSVTFLAEVRVSNTSVAEDERL